jgi:hypothetical protein
MKFEDGLSISFFFLKNRATRYKNSHLEIGKLSKKSGPPIHFDSNSDFSNHYQAGFFRFFLFLSSFPLRPPLFFNLPFHRLYFISFQQGDTSNGSAFLELPLTTNER